MSWRFVLTGTLLKKCNEVTLAKNVGHGVYLIT